MSKWYIKHFRDYHEIQSETFKTIELGCFPTPHHGYTRYFGLFYKGRKPSVKNVYNRMLKKVAFGVRQHHRTGQEIGIFKEDLLEEVKESMGNK